MNDIEQELRGVLEAKASNAAPTSVPSARVLRRARRRQLVTALAAIGGALALVVVAVVGISALTTPGSEPRPADLPKSDAGERSVVLPHVSLTYPADWYLLDLGGRDSPRFQLSNFDPGFEAIECPEGPSEIPADGVSLLVLEGIVEWVDEPARWPVQLEETDDVPCETSSARWQTAEGHDIVATATFAPDASPADRAALEDAFASLTTSGDRLTEDLLGDQNLLLDSMESPVGPVALYAYLEGTDARGPWLGIAGPKGSRLAGAVGPLDSVPVADTGVTMNLDAWGGVVWGDVADTATRAELRTVEGRTFPATLVHFPASLSADGLQAVWGVVEGETADRVTTLLYDSQGNVLNDSFPAEPRISIATGEDPEGGPWELYLDVTNDGTGLGFEFVNHGGGGGCCLRPLQSEFQLDGYGSGGGQPSNITALASDVVARIVFEGADGTTIEGGLYPVPDESIGIPQVGLVIVPKEVRLEGDLVAYDADGDEVGREFVGETPEPAGPTREIDAVRQALRAARDAAARYFERESTFTTLSLDALVDLARGPVTFSNRPEPESVSVFVTGDSHLAVSSTAITGEAFCIAVEAPDSPNSSFNYRYGSVFAESYDDCSGGW